jgi:flagellar biosynthesis anti-sigma factor FlgM
MRVDLTTYGVEPQENNQTSPAGQSVASGTVASSNSGLGQTEFDQIGLDQASFSFDQRVQSLQAQVMAQPEIRADKVGPLQEAIGTGEYSVSASQVADALANELSGATG